ncbi:MAG: hypothetical protein ABJB16_15060 [Saprospiraceae bacterium]
MRKIIFSTTTSITPTEGKSRRLLDNKNRTLVKGFTFLALIVSLVSYSLFIGCKKDENFITSQPRSGYDFDSFKSLYVDNQNDPENQNISEIQLLTALAFNNVIQNASMRICSWQNQQGY